jgi:hypothetical protein
MGGAKNSNECASVTENGDKRTIRAKSWDPVFNIGCTLADRYGISVSVKLQSGPPQRYRAMGYSSENSHNPFTFNEHVAAIFVVRCDAKGGMIYS